jgi:tRNA (guanine37-N1)-methyltransferase
VDFRGHYVPEVLLSGNHGANSRWRRQEALKRTWLRRPDLLSKARLSESDKEFLGELSGSLAAGNGTDAV